MCSSGGDICTAAKPLRSKEGFALLGYIGPFPLEEMDEDGAWTRCGASGRVSSRAGARVGPCEGQRREGQDDYQEKELLPRLPANRRTRRFSSAPLRNSIRPTPSTAGRRTSAHRDRIGHIGVYHVTAE